MRRELRVERGGSADARWEMTDGAPGAGLAGMVRTYRGYAERSPAPVARREFPEAHVLLVVGFGDPLLVSDAAGGHRLTSFVAGPGGGVRRTEHSGVQDGVEVLLSPWGAYQLLGVPVGELAGRVVDLAGVLGRVGVDLTERLAGARAGIRACDWEGRFALLDEVFAGLAARGPSPDPDLVHAYDRLAGRHGDLAIANSSRTPGGAADGSLTGSGPRPA